jgi:hypothetical protein
MRVVAMVVRQGAVIAACGVAMGLAVGLAVTRPAHQEASLGILDDSRYSRLDLRSESIAEPR